MSKTIVLTGGGTAGHVTPNLALLPGLRERGFDIHYIGSYNGIEKDLVAKQEIPPPAKVIFDEDANSYTLFAWP